MTAGTGEARAQARAAVVRAARACFRRTGVRKTTMDDVARAAGVSRQTVYKLFLGRRELVEAAVAERIGELADAIAERHISDQLTGVEALTGTFVTASVEVIEGIRADAEIGGLLGEGSPIGLHEALWLDAVARRGLRFWLPWLHRARVDGVLRADATDDELSDWLQTVYASLILRRDLGPAEERRIIERFVLTSMAMTDPPPTAAGRGLSAAAGGC